MKKAFVLLMIGLGLVPLAPAQNRFQPGFNFGLKAGLNIADFSGADVNTGFRTKTGFTAGGWLAYRLSNVVALQAEALYSQKGARIFTKVEGTTLNEWITLDYFELPLLFKFYPPLDAGFRPVFFAGPYIAFKASFKDRWEYGDLGGNEDIGTFRETETGFAGGAGMDFPVGKAARMSVELRYSRGLVSLSKNSAERAYNAVFAILAQIAFGK